MAYLGKVLEDLLDAVTDAIEPLVPHDKSECHFRRRTAEERQRESFTNATGVPRLFDFNRDQMVATTTLAGGGVVFYLFEIPLQIHYPRASGWHPAALDDLQAIHSLLASNPISSSGCHLCSLDLGSHSFLPSGTEDWNVVTCRITALIEADL